MALKILERSMLVLVVLTLCACSAYAQQQEVCPVMADIVFIIDQSGSITTDTYDNWYRILNFTIDFIKAFPIGPDATKIGVVTFSSSANSVFFLNRYSNKADLIKRINKIENIGGETNIPAALRRARTDQFQSWRGDRREAANIAILITDGNANMDVGKLIPEANRLKQAGPNSAELFCIGITDNIDEQQLKDLASDPDDEHFFTVSNFNQLKSIVQTLIENACKVIPTTPATTPRPRTPRPTPRPTTTTPRPTPKTPVPPTQPPCDVCECKNGGDVVFVVDASGSIRHSNFKKVQAFLIELVHNMEMNSGRMQMSVITFSSNVKEEFGLTKYKNASMLADACAKIKYTGGTTNTAEALKFIRENTFRSSQGSRRGVPKIAVIITDGESNDNKKTLAEARLVKKEGVHIITVGIGNWLDKYELEAIASFPSEKNTLYVRNFNALTNMKQMILDGVCDNTDECRSSPCRNGRCQNKIGHYTCQCNSGYSGTNCDKQCKQGADVVLAVDTSGSIGEANFKIMMQFVTDLVERLDIDNGYNGGSRGTRVGFLLFGTDVQLQFNLDTYKTKGEILNGLQVRFAGGTTNTADALKYIRENMFRSNNGARNNVPKIAVVITDGRSNDQTKTWNEALLARNSDITFLAVGIGRRVRELELQGIASYPVEKNLLQVENFQELNTISDILASAICNNEDECDSRPCFNGARCKDLINGYTCGPCPAKHTGPKCEKSCDGTIDLVFALDSSGSIRRERFPMVKKFVANVLDDMDIVPARTRVGLCQFSTGAKVEFNLDKYKNKQDVKQAIQYTNFDGGKTNIQGALKLVRNMFKSNSGGRDQASKHLIIVTDGASNVEPDKTIPEAIEARVEGIHVKVVAIGKDVNLLELEGIASVPADNNIFKVTSINDLDTLREDLSKSTCNEVDECRSNPCRNRGRCVDGYSTYMCQCRGGYAGYNCERRCNKMLDVVLVLDLSGSMDNTYKMVVEFARQMVYGLPDQTRFGVVAYATDIINKFYLNAYESKQEVINALNFFQKYGRTNTQEGIKVARNELFSSFRGDRGGVDNKMIVVSDGYSNVNEWNTQNEAKSARDQNIEVYAIGLGENPNFRELNGIANDPDSDYVFRVRDLNDVPNAASKVLEKMCQ